VDRARLDRGAAGRLGLTERGVEGVGRRRCAMRTKGAGGQP